MWKKNRGGGHGSRESGRSGAGARPGVLAGWAALASFYAGDFLGDVRGRDAFCWMDPYQYFHFARDLLTGARRFNEFELPSLFPFFVVPLLRIRDSIAAALCVNLIFLVPFLLAIWGLSRRLAPGQPPWAVAAGVLASPLLLGLSRSLYVEFALSALVAMQFCLWWESDGFTRRAETTLFAVLFALGCMTKMTYPLFLIGPAAVELLHGIRHDRPRAARLAAALALPLAAVVMVQFLVFRSSFVYYRRFGYTALPVMRLIGPLGRFTRDSMSFYFTHLGKTMLPFLWPWLLLPASALCWDRAFRTSRDTHLLLAWLLTPLALLILPEVKEPRHVAPCVPPALLLIYAGLSRMPHRRAARVLGSAAMGLALYQYWSVASHRLNAPYFVDRPSAVGALVDGMIQRDPRGRELQDEQGRLDTRRWAYTKNFALTGFDPNMALLLAWHLNPGVAYDLDALESPELRRSDEAYRSFEDLFLVNAFNLYNRRCLWPCLYETLDRETVVAHADYILARGGSPEAWAQRFPHHRVAFAVRSPRDTIYVLAAAAPSEHSYRELYARAYLQTGRATAEEEAAVFEDLCMNAALRGDWARLASLRQEWAGRLPPGVERKPIYYTANMLALHQQSLALRRAHE